MTATLIAIGFIYFVFGVFFVMAYATYISKEEGNLKFGKGWIGAMIFFLPFSIAMAIIIECIWISKRFEKEEK